METIPLLAPPRSLKRLPLLNVVILWFTDMRAMQRAGPNAIHQIRRQYAGGESPRSLRGSNEPSYHKTPPPRSLSLTDEATIISLIAESPSPSPSSRKATLASATVLLSERREGKRIRDVGIFLFREKKELLQSSNRSSLSFLFHCHCDCVFLSVVS